MGAIEPWHLAVLACVCLIPTIAVVAVLSIRLRRRR
jgi:hypothetical protein